MLRGRVGQSSFEGLSLYVLVGLVVLVVVGLVGFSLFSRVGDVGVESSCVTGVSFLQCSDVVATDRGVVLRLSSLQKNFFVDEVMVFESGVGGAVCVLDAVDSPLFVEGHTSLEVVVPCSSLLSEGVHAFEVVFVFFEPGDVLRDRLVAQAKVEVVVADERLVGGACVGGRCAFGLSCDVVSDTCKVGVGGSCVGGLSNQCVSGTSCDGDVCKVSVGGVCTVTDDCVSGATCNVVADVRRCSIPLKAGGVACTESDECESGVCGRVIYESVNNNDFTVGLDTFRYGFARHITDNPPGDVGTRYGTVTSDASFTVDGQLFTFGVASFFHVNDNDNSPTFRLGFEPDGQEELNLLNEGLTVSVVNSDGEELLYKLLNRASIAFIDGETTPYQKFVFNLNQTENDAVAGLEVSGLKFGVRIGTAGGMTCRAVLGKACSDERERVCVLGSSSCGVDAVCVR